MKPGPEKRLLKGDKTLLVQPLSQRHQRRFFMNESEECNLHHFVCLHKLGRWFYLPRLSEQSLPTSEVRSLKPINLYEHFFNKLLFRKRPGLVLFEILLFWSRCCDLSQRAAPWHDWAAISKFFLHQALSHISTIFISQKYEVQFFPGTEWFPLCGKNLLILLQE